MARKKYKTVSGYLRSNGEQLQYKLPRDDKEQLIAAVKAGQRDIINNLLPQLGLPMLDGSETPRDGINRLLALGGTDQQVKALKDCQRWLKNYLVPLSVVMVPQVTTSQGLVSYHVRGFKRDDHSIKVSIIVDTKMGADAFEIAEPIAGPDYCLNSCCNINHPVPDAVKNRLFMSDEELFAAVPELNPHRARRARPDRSRLIA